RRTAPLDEGRRHEKPQNSSSDPEPKSNDPGQDPEEKDHPCDRNHAEKDEDDDNWIGHIATLAYRHRAVSLEVILRACEFLRGVGVSPAFLYRKARARRPRHELFTRSERTCEESSSLRSK